MGEAIAVLFILITVMSISLVLFGGWVAVLSFKGIGRLVGMLLLGTTISRRWPRSSAAPSERCHQLNPSHAKFCRRCGARV